MNWFTELFSPVSIPLGWKSIYVYEIQPSYMTKEFSVYEYPRWAFETGRTYGHCTHRGFFDSTESAERHVAKLRRKEYLRCLKNQKHDEWRKTRKTIIID